MSVENITKTYTHLKERLFYWYHRSVIGFFEDIMVYDAGDVFSRRHLFDRKVSYGGDIPFIGKSKPFVRRHYRDWMTLETPKAFKSKNYKYETIEVYCGGYLPFFQTLDIAEFTRGMIEFDFAFYHLDENSEDRYLPPMDYLNPLNPWDPFAHVYYYRYYLIFISNKLLIPAPQCGLVSLWIKSFWVPEKLRQRMFRHALVWQELAFFYLEILRLPAFEIKAEGRLRAFWDNMRDPYKDGHKDEDAYAQGVTSLYLALGMFMIPLIDTFSSSYIELAWIKCHLLMLLMCTGVFLDQSFAAFAWYTLFKDRMSLTRLRLGHFLYYDIFLGCIFTAGFLKMAHWFFWAPLKPYVTLWRAYARWYIKGSANIAHKRYSWRMYCREKWGVYHNHMLRLQLWNQQWFDHYVYQYFGWEPCLYSFYVRRRLDLYYYQAHWVLGRPRINNVDVARPLRRGPYWMSDSRAKNVFTKADNNALGRYYLNKLGRREPYTYFELKYHMRPENIDKTYASWPVPAKYRMDAVYDYQFGFQDPATPIMEGIIDLHHDLFFFFVVIGGLVFWLIFRIVSTFSWEGFAVPENFYRNITHNTTAEVIWTILPALVLVIIATPSFSLLYAMEDIIKPSITVKVIGNQWYWSYEYFARAFFDESEKVEDETTADLLEQTRLKPIEKVFDSYMVETNDLKLGELRLLEVDNRIIVPTFTHVRFLITSSDVLHSFAVPSLGIKLDACPGRLNQTTAFITRQGLFYGQCSEICGINHAFMPIVVEAVDKGTMLGWLLK